MGRNKRVVIYTTSDFPYGMAPENLVRQLALGLYHQECSVKVIKLKGSKFNFENDLNSKIKSKNFIFKTYPKNEFLKVFEHIISFLYSPISVFKECIFNKTDLVILYGTEYPYRTMPFVFATKISGKKIIRIITDRYKKSVVAPVWWKLPKFYLYKLQQNKIDHIFHKLVFLSNTLMNDYIDNGYNPNRLINIPHFIDIDAFEGNEIKKSTNDFFTIGFCGTTREDNGILDLLSAFRILLDKKVSFRLLIIGDNSNQMKSFIKDTFQTSELDRIIITGFQSKNKVPQLLKECNVLVNPRKSGEFAETGFPTKLGEYFATKTPVITTSTIDFKKYFSHQEELMLVTANSPDEMANAIEFLENDKTKATTIGGKGYEWAIKNLDFKNNAKKLLYFVFDEELTIKSI